MKSNNKPGCLKFVLVGILILFIISLFLPDEKEVTENNSNVKSEIQENNVKPSWEYGNTENDKMDNSTIHYGIIKSINKVEFGFPYEGGSTLSIVLTKRKGISKVLLQIDKGQFMSSFNYEKTIRIKFDKEKPRNYGFSNESTGDTKTIFLNNSNSIIERLKKTKNVILEVEFYSEGTNQFEFNVEGLKWK